MQKVISRDGTSIAFEKSGTGPVLILVDGALCYRACGPMESLSKLLRQNFSVITYDRRGRGESGDTKPYAPEREIEDIAALMDAAGGSAFLFGASSGAAIALEAAARLKGVRKLALYEAPFIVDDSREPITIEYLAGINEAITSSKPGVAVGLFMKSVGVPAALLVIMRLMPVWKKLKSVAHTLPNDFAFVNDNQQGKPLAAGPWTRINVPALVLVGGKSPDWMQHGMKDLARVLPRARLRSLEGQSHIINAKVVAPALTEFFNDDTSH
jgi:pimeloyl-ACP methyl ester carboxylesterase